MPRHHFLPASYLALFSDDSSTLPSRKRVITIGDKTSKTVYRASASNVGCIKNFYTLKYGDDPESIDKTWSRYEAELPSTATKLIEGTIDAETWARILVPFASCLFVRGPDFDERFDERLKGFLGEEFKKNFPRNEDNTNHARLIELQRLLGPVAAAKWIVLTIHGDEPLITSDLGYAPFTNPITNDFGIAIPIGPCNILMISPMRERLVAQVINEHWMPVIEYYDDNRNQKNEFNKVIAGSARRFIYGPDEKTIKKYINELTPPTSLEPIYLGFPPSHLARAYEFTWHRLVAALTRHPYDELEWDFPLDLKAVSKGWYPPVIFPSNLIEFPSTLRREGDYIFIEFYDPEIYYQISNVLTLEGAKKYNDVIREASKIYRTIRDDKLKYRLLLARGNSYGELGKLRLMVMNYKAAIKINPIDIRAYVDLGYFYSKIGKHIKAIVLFTKAIDIGDDSGVAYLDRGSSYAIVGKSDDAKNDFACATRLLSDNHQRASAYHLWGSILAKEGNHKDAIKKYVKALDLFADVKDKAKCLFSQAFSEAAADKTQKAKDDLTLAIDYYPDFFNALYFRAQLNTSTESHEEAILDIDRAMILAQDLRTKSILRKLKSQNLIGLGKVAEAKAFLITELIHIQYNPDLFFIFGNYYLAQAKFKQAQMSYSFALLFDYDRAKSYNNRGMCKVFLGNHNSAIKDFIKALSYSPQPKDKASAYRNKAISLAYLQKLEDANSSFMIAEQIEPKSLRTYVAKGRLQWFNNEYSLALKTHKRVEILENEKIINPFVATTLLAMGESNKSIEILGKWLDQVKNILEFFPILMDLRFLQKYSPNKAGVLDAITLLVTAMNDWSQ